MARVVIHHEGQSIALPPGDTVIGRALECRIRFNDPAVSRHHLRLVVRGAGVVAQNLSSSNGTLVNGVAITEPVPLVDGDVLRIGHRRLRIEMSEEPRDRKKSMPPVMTLGREAAAAEGIFLDDEDEAREQTRPGEALGPSGLVSLTQSLADASKEHTCPQCRARCDYRDDLCPRCGYAWPAGRPSSSTQEIKVDVVAVRAPQRVAVEVPVV
jgi:predicted component of type VI protein secretion system